LVSCFQITPFRGPEAENSVPEGFSKEMHSGLLINRFFGGEIGFLASGKWKEVE
jgi:hypothetical protein